MSVTVRLRAASASLSIQTRIDGAAGAEHVDLRYARDRREAVEQVALCVVGELEQAHRSRSTSVSHMIGCESASAFCTLMLSTSSGKRRLTRDTRSRTSFAASSSLRFM